jgi:hypothetical protein
MVLHVSIANINSALSVKSNGAFSTMDVAVVYHFLSCFNFGFSKTAIAQRT